MNTIIESVDHSAMASPTQASSPPHEQAKQIKTTYYDKIKHHLKARDKPGDEIIIDYAFDGQEDDDDKYGLQTRLTKEQRLFRHRHKMKRSAKFILEKNLSLNKAIIIYR